MKIAFMKYSLVILLYLISCSKVFSQTAAFTSSTPSGCSPWLVHFFDASTGPVTSWNWDFGDGTQSTDTNPDHYFNPGVGNPYTVTLTVSNGTSSNTVTKTAYVTVFKSPQAIYSVSSHVACAGAPVTFKDS